MPTMTSEEAIALEASAADHDGRCDKCGQTIKVYRYGLTRPMAVFMRAMADAVGNTGVNDVDISTIGVAYSVRSQIAKIRQHGLVARIKDERGVQLPNRWLITTKGWHFINGKSVPKRVIVFNNQVLGHDEGLTTIHTVLGERFDPAAPLYEESPVSPAEARTYDDVRQPKKSIIYQAIFKGRNYGNSQRTGQSYEIQVERLVVGKPVVITHVDGKPERLNYNDIAAFQKAWRVV